MDATKKTKIPQLCAHKATGQSFIRIAGRAIYFGKTGLPRYASALEQWGHRAPFAPYASLPTQFWVRPTRRSKMCVFELKMELGPAGFEPATKGL